MVLPSYNGARKLPNLTPLLALLLAQQGVPVWSTAAEDPARVTSAEIFRDLGLPLARDADYIDHAWSRRDPAFVPTECSAALARLLDVRRMVGLRNPGHPSPSCSTVPPTSPTAAPRRARCASSTTPIPSTAACCASSPPPPAPT